MSHPRLKLRYQLEMFYDEAWHPELTTASIVNARSIAIKYSNRCRLRLVDLKMNQIIWEKGL